MIRTSSELKGLWCIPGDRRLCAWGVLSPTLGGTVDHEHRDRGRQRLRLLVEEEMTGDSAR
jgi:hypothetical protein